MTDRMLKVLVSSTSEDLKDYRAVARNEIVHLQWHPDMMEDFGAIPSPTASACRSKVEQCDVVLLIVGFRRGWVPTREQGGDGESSITALELAAARELHKPVLVMLADKKSWPGELYEKDQAGREWVDKFQKELNQPAEFFKNEEDPALPVFRTKVRSVLLAHLERVLEEQAAPQPESEEGDFDSPRDLLVGGDCIPFIGPGIYGDGPLSTRRLVRALWPDAPESQACLATASEYSERALGKRGPFLTRFDRILTEQTRDARPPAVHALLEQVSLKPLPILVSATHDTVLEDRLAAGRRCAIVTHIVRGRHEGKLLVLVRGRDAQICPADELPDLTDLDLIVYKPLGSPLLHRGLDPKMEIDTVVATESDHLGFLGAHENKPTKVPTAFAHDFQSKPIVFLGLQLDVWHYRLVLQVFRSAQLGISSSGNHAVRRPESKIEDMSWKNLGASLVKLHPNDFAQRVLQSMHAPQPEVSHG
jgi:hypothetical protein